MEDSDNDSTRCSDVDVAVGSHIEVLWSINAEYYHGIVTGYTENGEAQIKYNHGDMETLNLNFETWSVLPMPMSIPNKPRVFECEQPGNAGYKPIVDFVNQETRKARFRMPSGLPPTVQSFCSLMFPDTLLRQILLRTNKFIKKRKEEECNSLDSNITEAEILHFFTLITYMGVVKLPAKSDYWSSHRVLPSHSLITGMSQKRFKFIWRNISIVPSDIVGRDEECVWFTKIKPFIDHARNFFESLLIRPGLAARIDEMMIHFAGCSVETHRMKSKPIDQGYKMFVMCDSITGYVCYFTPDGRVAGDKGPNEYSNTNSEGGKLYHMILHMYEKG